MHQTQLCIFARLMRRTAVRALPRILAITLITSAAVSGLGCEQIEGRNHTRQGNRLFRETKFIDALAEYEKALTTVDHPIIHYNLGLAYSKVFKPGLDAPTRIGLVGTFACDMIPNTKTENAQVCVKEGDRRFDDCDEKNVCASSYQCKKVDLCVLDQVKAAEAAAQHFRIWVDANPSDNQTRKLMTQVWLDSEQYKLAIDYWTQLLSAKPDDTEIMGTLAGINLKAGDWKTSIDWYLKVADASKDPSAKIGAYQFIGNVAWSKLNSRTLTAPEAVELADKGIAALQKATELAPKNPRNVGLQASLYNFRSFTHGASWAAAIDRAGAQDLQLRSRVLTQEAKQEAEQAAPTNSSNAETAPGGAESGATTPADKAGG
jgi:tetratricopeptide (TPR) repeat protein